MPRIGAKGAQSSQGFGQFALSTAANYIEDVFSTYLYTGNSSTQTITNGIDLASKGGLVWTKCRSVATDHSLVDTVRGADKVLHSESTAAQVTYADITAFNASGYGINDVSGWVNSSGRTYASWTFRKQPKFFDVVTYTGTGAAQTIAHSLGGTVGALIVKRTSGTGNWSTFARTSGAAGSTLYAYFNTASGLNLTAAAGASGVPAESLGYITTTGFKPNDLSGSAGAGNADNINESGATYVAYLFAHNAGGFGLTGTDNVISCGSVLGGAEANLGFEPQWVLAKASGLASNWFILDTMRGFTGDTVGSAQVLRPNESSAETTNNRGYITSTGFVIKEVNGEPYIYIAIRRGPMKVPTDGTKVFSPVTRTGTGSETTVSAGFPPDWALCQGTASTIGNQVQDRLRGPTLGLRTQDTAAETSSATDALTAFGQNGINVGANTTSSYWNYSGIAYINYFLRRAPGFFDEVCYTGTGVARTVTHNLAAVPELMIVKRRDGTSYGDWLVYHSTLGNTKYLLLNTTQASTTANSGAWNFTNPTSTQFTVGDWESLTSTATYVAYLFATCPGVSKVGSYTGTGTTQTINCGFTAGARFVLIKATSTTGDWYVWDSARGIVPANDPYLLLNSTAAEVTNTDYIDTLSSGFEISSTAPAAINASGGSFIFLAIA